VVDRRESFLAELESLMGKPEPQPDNTHSTRDMTPELMGTILRNLPKESKFFRDKPALQPEEDYDPLSAYTPAQKAAILRVQKGVQLRSWRGP
jgi:hypothetical protein